MLTLFEKNRLTFEPSTQKILIIYLLRLLFENEVYLSLPWESQIIYLWWDFDKICKHIFIWLPIKKQGEYFYVWCDLDEFCDTFSYGL